MYLLQTSSDTYTESGDGPSDTFTDDSGDTPSDTHLTLSLETVPLILTLTMSGDGPSDTYID